MAVDNGRVQDAASARRWISDQLLLNLARFEAPLLLAHCRAAAEQDWAQLAQWCDEHRASRETRELYQESRQMGYSLQQLLNGLPELDDSARDFSPNATNRTWPLAGPWPRAPGTSALAMPLPPGCGAGWKTNWRC